MAKEIIHTIRVRGEVMQGILNKSSMRFCAVGNEKYGEYTTVMDLESLDFQILKETVIEWDDGVGK